MPPTRTAPPGVSAFARIGLCLFFLGLCCPLPASAALMRYEYSGIITRSEPYTGIVVGAGFWGTFSYDDEAPGKGPLLGGGATTFFGGQARFSGPILPPDGAGLSLNVGHGLVVARDDSLAIGLSTRSSPESSYSPSIRDAFGEWKAVPSSLVVTNPAQEAMYTPRVELEFDASGLFLGRVPELEELRGKLAGLPVGYLHVYGWPGVALTSTSALDGGITSVRIVPVPEPTTVVAFGGILIAVLARARFGAARRGRPSVG